MSDITHTFNADMEAEISRREAKLKDKESEAA